MTKRNGGSVPISRPSFRYEAADVAMQAIKDDSARIEMSWQKVYDKAKADIEYSRGMTKQLMNSGYISKPPDDMLQEAIQWAIDQVK
ncbi:MAG: hypothetical protein P9M11_10180 [Candidatus Tenebribacter burtonii]|nr:hypothetical protein [Candidatus Tenebribacter burtonii]